MQLKQMDCQSKKDALSEISKYPGAFNFNPKGCNPAQLSDSWKAIACDNQIIGYANIEKKDDEEYEFQICIKCQFQGKGKGKQTIDLIESETKVISPNARKIFGIVQSENPIALRVVKMLIEKGYRPNNSLIPSSDFEHAKALLADGENVSMDKELSRS